jgi:2-polyprenyl-3-methyl-5-hydroxy-6-metoxy-1,4-benzoquinol methylase/uncharacterized protein YbaR (Trm112 family)
MSDPLVHPELLEKLICPRDGSRLNPDARHLVCERDHRYPVVKGIPVLLRDDVDPTLWVIHESWRQATQWDGREEYFIDTLGLTAEQCDQVREFIKRSSDHPVDPVVQFMVAATSGILYLPLIGKMRTYPIPELRLPDGQGTTLLDVGCNWGRWSVAAARKGYRTTGIDPSLGALLAAQRVTKQQGLDARFVCGDARYLPFADAAFDTVFSFGVLQHFSRENVRVTVQGMSRVLKPNGLSFVQMPNAFGVRNAYQLARRRFRDGDKFEVRYWRPGELVDTFSAIGPTTLSVDGFFGLGIQPADRHMLPLKYRAVVNASEVLRAAANSVPWLTYGADSLYATSAKQ